ncbi:hypothetical protein C9413_16335 [Rhizobium sp. SEMIA 4085]|uniref:Uncharacterized protein n=1 Tax=Rhizobium gallicum bv. gallicum R602sp TaxID=1041138 RepID=A0A0B4WY45_9HYPH|nr:MULTISPECIES: hypothetical protein [Rhizobium]AJD40549.1 hypothetical protein RGR602_CH01191 [Rhizobium gallicum bv. gallicum R602sp]NNH31013.1 hypothetical protein [Rhizobium sp. SEMIA 4085]
MSLMLNSSYSPEDLDVLRCVIGRMVRGKAIDIKSADARFAASAALDLSQAGHTDSEKLLTATRSHKGL